MSKARSEKPTEWSPLKLIDVGGDVYVHVPPTVKDGDRGGDVLVYHWHEPSQGHARWQLTALGLHTIVRVDPLTIVASLACDEGCPNHGFVTDGTWRSV